MHEILQGLRAGAWVLDVGARAGSFSVSGCPFRTIRVDIEREVLGRETDCLQADAARLPFRNAAFDAVISNQSLEHFGDLPLALREVARVLKSDGALFVAVPDSGAVTDRIYRFFARGGGHVQRFRSANEILRLVTHHTGLPIAGSRTLFTSLSFLHPENRKGKRARRFLLLLGTGERTLRWVTWLFRKMDVWVGTRLSVYGWAFYFGQIPEPVETLPWTNVCVRCGAGHSFPHLAAIGAICFECRFPRFRCLNCNTWNLYTDDKAYEDSL